MSDPVYRPKVTIAPKRLAFAILFAFAACRTETVPEPQNLSDLISEFPQVRTVGNVLVGSDIGASFSEQHAVHLKLVWDYFDSVFARSRGDRLDMYYSSDRSKLLGALELCPTQAVNEPDARVLTACYGDHGYGIWFVEPFVTPDFGTQLHEISHEFVFMTYEGSATYPWFIEGTGMYYEGGAFQSDGTLDPRTVVPWLTDTFDPFDGRGELVPLDELVWLDRNSFYQGQNPNRFYAQAGLFFHYLVNAHPGLFDSLIARLNGVGPRVRDNQWVLDFITSGTGMTLGELDAAYLAYARSL